jgi:hypothetical protein
MGSARHCLARLSLLCACGLLGTAVHAGNIRGVWDPDLGGAFTGTGFRGQVSFFVPDACLPAGVPTIGFISDGAACSGGGMYLIGASVTFYDTNGTPTPNDDTDLGPPIVMAPPVQSPDPVLGVAVNWDGYSLLAAELRTDLIGPRASGLAPLAPANFFLRFSWGVGPGDETLPAGAYVVPCNYDGDTCYADTSAISNPGVVTYSTPEPGSLALLLSAFAAGWLARWRRAAA